MSFESIDDANETDLPEPRWIQYAGAALGAAIAVGVAVWGLSTPRPANVGVAVLGEALGWALVWFFVRGLTKGR